MNFILQIALISVCSIACASSVALLIIEIVKKSKSKVRLSKEEKARIKEDKERKELVDMINKCNANLDKLNKKK